MTTRNIDDQLRQYYAGAELAPGSLERMRAVLAQRAEPSPRRKASSDVGAWRVVAVAASLALLFLAASLWVLRTRSGGGVDVTERGVSERFAAEAARRHGRCIEEIEFRADDLPRLLAQMKKVDFAPAVPARSDLAGMKVKGAHYCVLQGQIAIHVVLVRDDGSLVSVFETKAGADIASLQAATHRLGGSRVELWQERGVLFAAVNASSAG